MQFRKLKRTFKVPAYAVCERQLTFWVDDNERGIEYKRAICEDDALFWDMLPKTSRQDFCFSLMCINANIPPHTDSGIKTVINFYLQPANYITQFYQDLGAHKWQVANQTDGFLLDPQQLSATDHFEAQPNDIYVLDVATPHSVQASAPAGQRVAINLSTHLPFAQVCDLLHQTGSL